MTNGLNVKTSVGRSVAHAIDTVAIHCSGCVSVGSAVSSDARGYQFESSHWQTFLSDIYLLTVNCIEKTKIKKKRPGMAHFLYIME